MAENKKALAIETANANGNAAITERLDDVAERMAEAQKATDAVAKEQKQRLAEQEQSAEKLQKEEAERLAQVQEEAKSVADRRAAVLDYTENYRENQKKEKAARATASKTKQKRLAEEAEAKAKAEREAEEALQREREELMARRARSSALLKKTENESETEAPAAKPAAARPVERAMPKRESAPAAKPIGKPEVPAEKEIPAPQPEIAKDEAPAILEADPAPAEQVQSAPAKDDAAFAEEAPLFAPEASAEEAVAINNNEAEKSTAPASNAQPLDITDKAAIAKKVDEDIQRIVAEDAARAAALEEEMLKARIAGMMPAHLIPDSLRLFAPDAPEKKPAEPAAEPAAVPAAVRSISDTPAATLDGDLDGAMQRLEDAVAAAERSSAARLAAALRRVEDMAARAEETADRLEKGEPEDTAPAEGEKSLEELAEDAVSKEGYDGEVLPAAPTEPPFTNKELRRYLKTTKADIEQKKQELFEIRKEPGENNRELAERRLEQEAAILGTQFGAMALLSSKGHDKEAQRFAKDAEKGVQKYNKDVDKYNKRAEEKLEKLPADIVSQILTDRRLPENVPFGSTTTELNSDASDYAVVGGMLSEDGGFQAAPFEPAPSESGAFAEAPEKALNREESKALRKEMQKEMLLHAMMWSPEAKKKVKNAKKADAARTEEQLALEAEAKTKKDPKEQKTKRDLKREDKNLERQKYMLAEYEAALAEDGRDPQELKKAAAAQKYPDSAAKAALLMSAADEAFLKKLADRDAYYENRCAMLDAKRAEIAEANYHNRNLPKGVREEIAAAHQLNLIQDEMDLLCLMNRYPDDKRAAKCMQSGIADIEEYNRLAESLKAEGKQLETLSMILPAQALAHGENMPLEVWQRIDRAIASGRKRTTPSKREMRAAYAQILADEELRAAIREDEKRASRTDAKAQTGEKTPVSSRMAYGEEDAERVEGTKPEAAPEAEPEKKQTDAQRYAEAALAATIAEDEKRASKQKAEDASIAFAHGGKRNAFASEEKEVYGREAAAEYYANAADPLHSNISDRKLRRAADAYISEKELASDVEGADLSADERQLRLNCAASEALERSEALSDARKEELLAAAKQATKHSDDKKKQKKLDRMTASAAKREAKNADRALEEDKKNLALLAKNRDMAEAKALAAEQEAADAMERVSALRAGASNKKKPEAYSEALSASARAESARLTADTLAAEYESEKEKAIERQKAKAAMLAFAAVASAEYENSKGMPLSGSDKRKLNTAILDAQRRYDRALLASRDAEARLSLPADAKASSSRLAAARRDAAKAEVLAADAQQRLNTLLATREATECSKALGRREKAELVALAIAATEKNDEKLKARLKKSVAAALRKEEKAARRFEKHFDRNMDRYEKRAAETEAEARVAADSAAKAKAKADKLAEKKAETEALHAAYEHALSEQSLAAEARAVADSARLQRDIEKRRAEAYKEAGEAMLALSATLTARDNEQKNSKKQAAIVLCETRKLDAAIEDANRKLEAAEKRSIAAAKNELELLERKRAKKSEIMAAHATYLEAREEAERANSKKEMLEKARIAATVSKALKAEEKAELLSLATELSADEKNTLKEELLKKKIEYAAQKEALVEKKLAEAVSRREDSLEVEYLYQEAKAHIAEESANEKKKKAERLARRRVNKKTQKKAYKDALLEQARAERERERAEELKAKRLAKKEKSEQYKESAAAMLAFAAAFAPIEKKKKTKAKEEEILSTVLGKPSYTGFIGTEITEAERQYENALLAEVTARERVRVLESEGSTKKERKAALLAVGLAEEETIRAARRLEKLEAAKRATEKSKELSPEEKAEMLALAASANAASKRERAALKKQKSAVKALKQEARAEKRAACRTQSQLRDWEKKVAKAEAKAIVSEERKALAKSKAKQARLEKKSEKALERAYKEALVSEYKADKARRKADSAQAARQSKREKEARIAEHKEAELAMLAFAAAMDKESKRGRREKNALLREVILEERRKEIAEREALADEAKATRKSKLEERSAKEVELYARALERKAMRSEQKALLLVPVKGKAKKKLKVYEEALFDRAAADEARTLANTLNGEDAAPVAIATPLSRKAQKLQQSADEALNKQKKAHKRLNAEARYADKVARRKDESLQKKYDSKMKKLQKRASKADLAAQMAQMKLDAQLYKDGVKHEPTAPAQVQNTEAQASQPKHTYVDKADRRLQKKQQKEAFAREKKELKREFKRYVIESRVQKRDLNALRKAALAGQIKDERLARKLQYKLKVEQKQRVKDEKAWKALEKHDEKLARHYSYMSLLELDRRDQERLKAKAEEQKMKKLAPAAAPEDLFARGIFTKKLTRRERLARNRAYKKRDIKTLKARYDIVIAEAKRDLELALCDLSCTKANAKRIKVETKKRIWKLCANKRRALQNEKVDNHRYFRCLRKSRIKPKNHRVDRAELARLYEKLERLLEMRDKVNESLYTVYSYDSYKKLGRVDTPWHKAFMREKKRWHKKLRGDLRVIDSMNLSRRDKQKLRADLDCVATSHADIVETKCRIQKQKLKGAAKRLQKQEIKAMKRDAIKAHNHMKRKMNIARAKADKREFWYVSMLSLAITLSLICICVLGWHWFGDKIMGFMNANFPSIVTKIKSLLK